MIRKTKLILAYLLIAIAAFSQSKEINTFEWLVNDKFNNHQISSHKGISSISIQDNKNPIAQSSTIPSFLFSSNLPIVVIETMNLVNIPDDPKIPACMGIIYNGENKINSTADSHNHWSGKVLKMIQLFIPIFTQPYN